MTAFFKKHPITGFIGLTFIISLLIGFPLKLFVFNNLFTGSEIGLNYFSKILVVFGPALAAIIITYITSGKSSVIKLLSTLRPQTKHIIWWFALPFAGILLTIIAFVLSGFTFAQMGWQMIKVSPLLLIAHFACALLFIGFGEELGWRGYLLPKLAKNRSIKRATFLLFIIWSLWHLPIFFSGYRIAIPFVITVFSLSIIFTWLWEHTGQNIFVLALAHASVDFPEGFFEARMSGNPNAILTAWTILSVIYLIIALVIFFATRKWWDTVLPLKKA